MWIAFAALNLACAVSLGAFGAHGLKNKLTPEQLAWWHTGVDYQFYHALGLLLLGVLMACKPEWGFRQPAWCLQVGIIIFSGTLYAMALGAPRWFGAITPLGGTAMIIGWLWLALLAWQRGI